MNIFTNSSIRDNKQPNRQKNMYIYNSQTIRKVDLNFFKLKKKNQNLFRRFLGLLLFGFFALSFALFLSML